MLITGSCGIAIGLTMFILGALVQHIWWCYRYDRETHRLTGKWWADGPPGSWRWLRGCFR